MPSSLASQKGKLTGMNSGVAGKLFDDSRLCLNPRGIHPHYTAEVGYCIGSLSSVVQADGAFMSPHLAPKRVSSTPA